MRRPLIAGNWKMNLNRAESLELARGILSAQTPSGVDVVICPTYVYLDAVATTIKNQNPTTTVTLGAQDVYDQPNGAFTGEISTTMLVDVGCKFVILGHSERRIVMGETDQLINRKVLAALSAGLTPILCVGEQNEQREAGKTMEVVQTQFDGSLSGISAEQAGAIIIAYEPVWAIGTGKTATPQQAQEVHADLRNLMADRYNDAVAKRVRILYGGSVKPENAAQLLAQADIDGALVGGASLNADVFLKIIAAA